MKRSLILLVCFFGYAITINAQYKSSKIKPAWVTKGVPEETATHIFISAFGDGASLDAARQKCFINLTTQLEHERGITVNSKFRGESHMSRENGYQLNQDFSMDCEENGKDISIVCSAKDEYFEKANDGSYICQILYSVANQNSFEYDFIDVTASYANDPTTWGLSLIPGAAQMHKGSYVKGGIIMGGSVALVGGIIAFENIRADNMSKISQTHSADVKKTYNNNANNAALGRNICIGGLAALYVYNILDAIIAPGARRIIVTPSATADGQYGLSASLSF